MVPVKKSVRKNLRNAEEEGELDAEELVEEPGIDEESGDADEDSSESADDDEQEEEDEEGEDQDSDDDLQESEEGEYEEGDEPVQIQPSLSAMGEQCTFDLCNLLAVNSHQVAVSKLYSKARKEDAEHITIPSTEALSVLVNEAHLLEKATDGCTQLIHALWQLPTDRSDAGPMVSLPSYSEIKLPRQLPPPPPKQETKWEKFAKEKGIPLNKKKRSQKVWDEATESWKFRHGYNKANDNSKEWPIMEVKDNEDPFADPWERLRDAKRARTDKNLESQLRNQERAGLLPKGATNKTMKSREKIRKAGKAGGNADRDSVPVGVPVDIKSRKGSEPIKSISRGRDNTQKALLATQRSTASLGKFDAVREGEPERRKALAGLKKRKFESATDKNVIESESQRGMKVLNAVISSGGAAAERAKRKGALAKGETAYDYEFDDGLGPSTFKKKKGRAGAGKIKKLTKKRIQ